MKDIELLLPRVLEKAAACPEPTAIRHLLDAAIEFCRRTRVWRSSDSFTLPDDGCEVVAVEPGQVLYEISHARYVPALASGEVADPTNDGGTDLVPVTMDWLDENEPGWRDKQGTPVWITQSAPDTVRVVPKPEVATPPTPGSLKLQLILLPSTDADQVPDVLIDSYSLQIADGAIGAVLLLPAEFGNPQLGAFHKGEFNKALDRFGARVPMGQQRSKRRTKPSSFF